MTAAPFHLAGERVMLDPGGVLVWPAAGLLAVADLHLEKATAAARRGALLPPWDSRLTLDRLLNRIGFWRPRIVVALGDSFHDPDGPARLPAGEADRLHRLADTTRLVWVSGNHDPHPTGLPGEHTAAFHLGPLAFRHESANRRPAEPAPHPDERAEICGHHHPKASVPTRGGPVCRPCFVADAARLILPAFGTFTGGLDVGHPAIATLFPRGGRAFLLGTGRLFSFNLAELRAPHGHRVSSA